MLVGVSAAGCAGCHCLLNKRVEGQNARVVKCYTKPTTKFV